MSENLQIPKEFFEYKKESQQLDQTTPKSKKNAKNVSKGDGPYPIQARKQRRDVFKLHFDYWYSARKIAVMMNVSRHTISSDILFCYSQLQKEEDKVQFGDLINKTLYRLETKRIRIMERLDKTTIFGEYTILEKMLNEIDSRLFKLH